MGSMHAREFANMAQEGEVSMEQAIAWHLRSNHYPPVPLSMVQPCIDAIRAIVDEGDVDAEITLPEGVLYIGMPTAPAWAIVEQHHLEAWLEDGEEF